MRFGIRFLRHGWKRKESLLDGLQDLDRLALELRSPTGTICDPSHIAWHGNSLVLFPIWDGKREYTVKNSCHRTPRLYTRTHKLALRIVVCIPEADIISCKETSSRTSEKLLHKELPQLPEGLSLDWCYYVCLPQSNMPHPSFKQYMQRWISYEDVHSSFCTIMHQ